MGAVGSTGTALFPTFTNPVIYNGLEVNKDWSYRPFDPQDLNQIRTGVVPRTLLEEFPEARRSCHVSCSWAGLGPKAAECTVSHGATEAPGAATSPMGKALENGGKIVYIGTGLTPSVFLHYLETACGSPILQPAICRIKAEDGSLRTGVIEQHWSGHRDFYGPDAKNSKFFTRAVEAGLHIAEVPFGMNCINVIDMKSLYSIGMELLKADPRILLCDDPDCLYCREF